VTENGGQPGDPAAGSGRLSRVSGSFGGHSKARKERLPWLIGREGVSPHARNTNKNVVEVKCLVGGDSET
jgi:hypothetical protein